MAIFNSYVSLPEGIPQYRTSIHGGYKSIVQFIVNMDVNGGRYTQMLLLVLKVMNPNIHPCPKSPSFVGQYTSTMLRIYIYIYIWDG